MTIRNPADGPKTSAAFDIELRKQAGLANIAYEEALENPRMVAAAKRAEEISVFGVDAPIGPDGHRQQVGIGSPGHETLNHFSSIRRYQGEAKFQQAIKKMWRENPQRVEKIGLEKPERLSA